MGDLISRSALIEAITQHGKDIKSDVPMIEDIYQTAHKHIIDLVEIQPTAFDVEKVVAKLEEASHCEEPTFDEDGYCNDDSWEVVYLDKATEIVRKGGVE